MVLAITASPSTVGWAGIPNTSVFESSTPWTSGLGVHEAPSRGGLAGIDEIYVQHGARPPRVAASSLLISAMIAL